MLKFQIVFSLVFLAVSMVTVALDERKNRFYWMRLFERMDNIEKKMDRFEKREEFVVKQVVESGDKEN